MAVTNNGYYLNVELSTVNLIVKISIVDVVLLKLT